MDILRLVKENETYLIEMRRYFHRHPELSGKEEATVERISQELTELGVEHVVVPGGGILGFIEGAKPGKTVLLRADVDALPVPESENNAKGPKVAISENPGVCHACGHDAHTAMLLVAAKVLVEHKEEINGKVVLMFERGEEAIGCAVYLRRYIDVNKIHIDSSYGTHVYSMLESGKICLRAGPVMAGNYGFQVKISGKGGHGSRPDQSVSPIDCFVAVYAAMNAIRMRSVSPFNSLTFSLGKLQAGEAGNVIPDDLVFAGTCRVFETEDGVTFKKTLETILRDSCEVYGCTYQILGVGPGIPVKNDPECSTLAKQVIGEAIGTERIEDCEPWMASESMGVTLMQWPGVFARLGIMNPEKGMTAAHHNADFDVDEEVLIYGAAGAVAYALGFLKSDIDTAPRKWKGTVAELYRVGGRSKKMIDYLDGKEESPL